LKNWIFYSLLLGLTAYAPNISINNNNIRLIPRITIPDSEEFQAFGTEPFWSVKVSHTGIVYYSFDRGEKQTFPYIIPLSADGCLPDTVRVFDILTDLQGRRFLTVHSNSLPKQSYSHSLSILGRADAPCRLLHFSFLWFFSQVFPRKAVVEQRGFKPIFSINCKTTATLC
jgi:hypothetical protein